ncbi:hypothetical protein ULMS_04750 [Patiriisocius marinistellae]|uniref:IPExxxVDY family protein n=1 Tax=Patiriisocius marinistellae TaxID=2494560 RepID=A0A5J4FSF5_9FLAO|nr:IPExxxVDY family protein [Patiriisocius marinistellae]GEQ84967.1 hypothetical protein ULMS_04750 [Patiriisocius marinistellae]
MGTYKLILDDDFKEEFSLIAIHCSEEPFRLAYLLNQFVELRLMSRRVDLDFSKDGLEITFPLYDFEDEMKYTSYNLVANRCKSHVAKMASSGSLFGNITNEETITTYVIPEYKQVDYFLKIQSDFNSVGLKTTISKINEIKQVISAYEIDVEKLKSKNNLIFD